MAVRRDDKDRARFDPAQRAKEMRFTGIKQSYEQGFLTRLEHAERAINVVGGIAMDVPPARLITVTKLPEPEASLVGLTFILRNENGEDAIYICTTNAAGQPVMTKLNTFNAESLDAQLSVFLDPVDGAMLDIPDPSGIAMDSDGWVYVGTLGAGTIRAYTGTGEYQYSIAPPLGTYSTKWGTTGVSTGQFNGPTGIAVRASDGFVAVADLGNNRVQIFDANGTFQTAITSLTSATGVCFDASGNLYVSYSGNIRKYNSTWVLQWTQVLANIGLLATDGTHLYCPDFTGNKIYKRLCADGSAVTNWNVNGTVPIACAVNATHVFVVESSGVSGGDDRIEKFTKTGTLTLTFGLGTVDTIADLDYVFTTPYGIAINPITGNLVIADVGPAAGGYGAVLEWTSGGVFVRAYADSGSGNGQLNGVRGVAFNAAGTSLYVADAINARIQRFTTDTVKFQPTGLSIDPATDDIYATHTLAHQIVKFDVNGVVLLTLGTTSGSADGQFTAPTDVAAHPSGDVFVLDSGNSRVQKFDSAGAFLAKVGTAGIGNGQFVTPQAIALDSEFFVLVADTGNQRIQRFTGGLDYDSQFGGNGTTDGQFLSPSGVAADADGLIWVTDQSRDDIQVFSEARVFVDKAHALSVGGDAFDQPRRVVFAANRVGYVADYGNDRIIAVAIIFNTLDSTFVLQNSADLTKQARFVASDIDPHTTRDYTFPNASGVLALATDLFPVINVKHPRYGAMGDDATDDTLAFVAAREDARILKWPVVVPDGTYLTQPLLLDTGYDDITIMGVGRGASILKQIPSLVAGSLIDIRANRCTVRDLTLDGGYPTVTSNAHGLRVFGDGHRVENVDIQNCRSYGLAIGQHTGSVTRDFVGNHIHITTTGDDGVDVKNRMSLNRNIHFSKLYVSGFDTEGAGGKAGIDMRGTVMVDGLYINGVPASTGSANCGFRFRNGEIGDPNGLGGHGSAVNQFTIVGSDAALSVGASIVARDTSLSNGQILNCITGVNGSGLRAKVVNVDADSCATGFFASDDGSLPGDDMVYTNCVARDAVTGFDVRADYVRLVAPTAHTCTTGISVDSNGGQCSILGADFQGNTTNLVDSGNKTQIWGSVPATVPKHNVGLRKTQTSVQAGDTIANSSAATNFATIFTIPDLDTHSGKAYRLRAWGVLSTDAVAGPTLSVSVRLGGSSVATTGAQNLVAGITNGGWMLEADLITVTDGASGTAEVHGRFWLNTDADTAISWDLENTATIAIDTTLSRTFCLRVQWGTADADNTITQRALIVESLG